MAALNVQVSTGENASNQVSSSAKTYIAILAPTNQRVKVRGFAASGKGTSNTDSPVKVELVKFATISGGTAGTVVSSAMDGDVGETIQTTVSGNYNSSGAAAEPTYGTAVVVRVYEVHPQTGYTEYFPNDFCITLKGGTGIALRATSVQNETMTFHLFFEE